MHPDLQDAIAFHEAILAEGGKALVGYQTPKILANIVLLSEIPTTYDKKEQRQVNSGNLLLRGVPGVGKTFFGVILAAISNAKFARIQGRADLQPTEVVGFQMINPATGELTTEMGPLAEAEVILLDEINRIPLKSQSAFLEGLQDRTVTVGKTTYELPAFNFAIATMNPVELGQGTFPLSEAATDRFAIMVNIGYLPPEEERKLVHFDFKQVRLNPLMAKERIIQLRAAITEHVFLHERLGDYIQRLVANTRPYNPDTDWLRSLAVGAGGDGRRPGRLAARDHRVGPAGQGVGAARAAARRGLPRGHPGPGAVRARAPALARPARRQPRAHHRGGGQGRHRAHAYPMRTREQEVEPLINLSEITEVELLILKRMREFTIGEHASLFHGTGFDYVGLRDWQAGDRFEAIDWPQSSLNNFSPLIVREFEQPTTSGVVIVADRSASTRCGVDATGASGQGLQIATLIARSIATIGMSAVFFQDSIGLITFDEGFRHLGAVRPRIGKGQVIHVLDAYQDGHGLQEMRNIGSLSATLTGFSRKTSMMPVVSDFLFDDVEGFLRELSQVNNVHDVFVMMVDASFAFNLPRVSAGWVEVYDVETGRTRMLSRRELGRQADRIRAWQDAVEAKAKAHDLDVVRLSLDQVKFDVALIEWVAERRLRRRK